MLEYTWRTQWVFDSPEYKAISDHYEGQYANRSGLPYINHIHEGLWVLDQIKASAAAKRAYCLHPLVQGDLTLPDFDYNVTAFPKVLVLAMEYRNVANRYLVHHCGKPTREARLSPLDEVNQMLIADKVQNRKDFEDYHLGTHIKSDLLFEYFWEWCEVLGISDTRYQELASGLRA